VYGLLQEDCASISLTASLFCVEFFFAYGLVSFLETCEECFATDYMFVIHILSNRS